MIFTSGLAFMYASISAWVFLLRVGLPQKARARLVPPPPPPPWEHYHHSNQGRMLPGPVVAAAASPPAPIKNCLRFRAISSPFQ